MKLIATGLASSQGDGLYANLTFGIERGEPLELAVPVDDLQPLAIAALTFAPVLSKAVQNGEEVTHLRAFEINSCAATESGRGVAVRLSFNQAANFVGFLTPDQALAFGQQLIAAAQAKIQSARQA